MAFTFEELIGSVQVKGADKAKSDVDGVRSSFRTLGDMIESLGTLGGLTYLIGQLQDLGRTLSEVTGVGIAARFMGISRALEAVTGSGQKANRILEQLKVLGQQTPFNTADIAGTAAQMLGAGVKENRVIPELSALLDLSSHGMGVSRTDFPEFMRNLIQIRGRTTGKADQADINQLRDRVPQIGSFLAAGMGGGISSDDALKKAQSMTGRELYDTLIKGSQAMAKGAAAAAALLDPFNALGNVLETFQMAMEPTGKLLLTVLMPIISFGQSVADVVKSINSATFGFAGLSALVLGGGGLVYALGAASIGIRTLTTAVQGLAVASGVAAGGAAAGAGATGWMAALGGILMTTLRFGMGAVLSLALGNFVDQQISGDGKSGGRNAAGNFVGGALAGAGIGALFFGLPGALIGSLIGAMGAAINNRFFGGDKPVSAATDPAVQELKKHTGLLENLTATVKGGGPRTASAASTLVADLQLERYLRF